MAFFLLDANGNRIAGPYDTPQLQELATQGRITQHTPLESDTGHKGVAGQIEIEFPGAPPPSPPSNIPNRIKPLVGGVIAVAVIAAVAGLVWFVLPLFSGGSDMRAILKNAKPGDLAKYDVTIAQGLNTEKGQSAFEVLSNDGKTVRIRYTTKNPYGGEETKTISIDLTQPEETLLRHMLNFPDVPGEMEDARIVVERGRRDKETLSVANQQFNCVVTFDTVIATFGSITVRVPVVEWRSKSAPVFGLVKSETIMSVPDGVLRITMTLTDSHKMR